MKTLNVVSDHDFLPGPLPEAIRRRCRKAISRRDKGTGRYESYVDSIVNAILDWNFPAPGVIQLHLSGRSVCSNNEAAIEIEQDWSMTASKDNSVDGVELPIATFEPLNTTNVRTSTPPSSPNQAAHSVKASSSNLFHSKMMKWAVQLKLERKSA
ncbi:hypothetical protein BT96DRAFT_1011425 [Gymnopus androsaceus JB14]|uniref:Uncharacterized protein n=1 Tax=Gymnopus androsaceus JB14 TaxID=1447944 RepID=A0A6A4IP85_9AGAR|nr:hypothetical protein BT96DRAFT_1011425 [Gymnopus androsaceus JB14]